MGVNRDREAPSPSLRIGPDVAQMPDAVVMH